MSEENVEVVRQLYEQWSSGDAALDLLDPELELAMPVGRPDEQRFHGHAGFLEWVREWIAAWETHRVETWPAKYLALEVPPKNGFEPRSRG